MVFLKAVIVDGMTVTTIIIIIIIIIINYFFFFFFAIRTSLAWLLRWVVGRAGRCFRPVVLLSYFFAFLSVARYSTTSAISS